MRVYLCLPCHHTTFLVENVEFSVGGCSVGCPKTIVQLNIIMLNRVVTCKVQVNLWRDIDLVLLYAVGGVINYIQVTRKSVTLRIDGHKSQINTLITIHHNGVHNIVLIKTNCHTRGERRYKTVVQQIHTVVIDVYIFKECLDVFMKRTV